MATYAQRLSECLDLMSCGKGLVAIPLADRDAILVKDPSYSQPTVTGVVVWYEWAAGAARTAYGL